MPKTDFTRKYKAHYTAQTRPGLIEAEPVTYLSIPGQGDPSAREYADRLQALYTLAYTIKFLYKGKDQDFTVPKLEGLWWYDETQYPGVSIKEAPVKIPRDTWFSGCCSGCPNRSPDRR